MMNNFTNGRNGQGFNSPYWAQHDVVANAIKKMGIKAQEGDIKAVIKIASDAQNKMISASRNWRGEFPLDKGLSKKLNNAYEDCKEIARSKQFEAKMMK